MPPDQAYAPTYRESWALIVGIDDYDNAHPLQHAREDAQAVHHVLRDDFNFPSDNITTLYDGEATREAISEAFLNYADSDVLADDRLIFFFAGHGYTREGARGEIGFLVPHDGDTSKLSSLIRWDDLTRNSELIAAKHILFLMDACYGGLALQRGVPSGSARFVKDMLQRYGRQVLTAGKANETVSDSGGPRAGHSVFTGHLLDALEGQAATEEGILTANRVCSYVYSRVATDRDSHQTPHYGFLQGEGDLLFDLTPIEQMDTREEVDTDILIEPTSEAQEPAQNIAERAKKYLSTPEHRIQLDDLLTGELRRLRGHLTAEKFPTDESVDPDSLTARLDEYEELTRGVQTLGALFGKWGTEHHRPLFEKLIVRLSDREITRSGKKSWIALQRYPEMLTLYCGGIGALANKNFHNLNALFSAQASVDSRTGSTRQPVAATIADTCADLSSAGTFNRLPGREREFVPRSEHLFKRIQPTLEDVLFLGRDYERYFDWFEVFFALEIGRIHADQERRIWGPLGRFGYKHARGFRTNDPFSEVWNHAETMQDQWPPLQAGLFGGTFEQFAECWNGIQDLIGSVTWF